MDDVYVQSQTYPAFKGYTINKKKAVARYEYSSSEPINCHLGKSKMSQCTCGGVVVSLAYVFETKTGKSRILLGKKCTKCGNNYFTSKTISLLPVAFNIKNVVYDDKEEQEIIVRNDREEYIAGIRQALYDLYNQIFLIAYDKGIDLNRSIQEVNIEIDELKKEDKFEYEPEGYSGLWMVQSMADKLNVSASQLFVPDKKLKKRVVEDILSEAIKSKDNMDIDFIDEASPESAVQIEFPINKMNSCCTRQDVNIYCAELMNFKVTNELPNNERVVSKYLVRLCKGDGLYSICLSARTNNIQNTAYIYEMIEIYSEECGKLQELVDDCIAFELHNLAEEQLQTNSKNENLSILNDTISNTPKDVPMQTRGRELPETELVDGEETELVAAVYDTTRTMDILNKFEGLVENGKPYERLVIANGNRVNIASRYWMHYVVERSKNKDYVGDITFTNFKLGHIGELWNHIKNELEHVNIENYVDKNEYIKFKNPFHLRAQNKRNRTGYGWEWDWSSGYGDYTEGTLYGETTDYVFSGVYISSNYTYDQSKRKKILVKADNNKMLEDELVSYYKVAVDGYVKGEYTLVVSSSSPIFKSKNKRIQLFIKAERAGKCKYVPVACDIADKLLYMNRATFDYYRAQINRQHPVILHKTYIE